MSQTKIADVVVPEFFTPYSDVLTTNKSPFISSGVFAYDGVLQSMMERGGTLYNFPAYTDLSNVEPRSNTDDIPYNYPNGVANPDVQKLTAIKQIAVGMNKNMSWGSSALAGILSGTNPMAAIGARVSAYWDRQLQNIFINVMKGVFADNAAVPTGGEHVKDDMTYDIKGAAYKEGETTFSGTNLLRAAATMGDEINSLQIIMMHSVVNTRLAEKNMIQTIQDSEGRFMYESYMGKRVIVNDNMPNLDGVYETWLFGPGAFSIARVLPDNATEVERIPGGGNGGGSEVLYSRIHWCVHPNGHSYIGSTAMDEPKYATLSNGASWKRVFPERKQIRIARLITREAPKA